MKLRDIHDVIGGAAMGVIGTGFAVYGHVHYAMGTSARMGPGYFPIVLGWLLAVLGLLVALPALWRQGTPIVVQWKNLAFSVASLLVFAVLLRTGGIILAAFTASLVALVPAPMRLRTRFTVSAVVALITVLIFVSACKWSCRRGPGASRRHPMELLDNLWLGLRVASEPSTLAYCFFGVFLGTLVGVLPGIGALAAISLLLPITYHIPPRGDHHAGRGLLRRPVRRLHRGDPAEPARHAIVRGDLPGRLPDGQEGTLRPGAVRHHHRLAGRRDVRAHPARAVLSDDRGGRPEVRAAEFFSMMILGLVAASSMSGGSAAKGLAMVVFGILLGMVGTDVNTGVARYSFDIPELMDRHQPGRAGHGPVRRGGSRALHQLHRHREAAGENHHALHGAHPAGNEGDRQAHDAAAPPWAQRWAHCPAWARPSRPSCRTPSKSAWPGTPAVFGQGAIEGISAPESANNAAAQTAFVPSLSLGIPGDAVMAVMLGALIIHGINPGPMLMTEQPELFWGLIVSFAIGNIMLVLLNIPTIGLWVALLRIPFSWMYPAILVFVALGVYSVNNNTFDIYMVALLGTSATR